MKTKAPLCRIEVRAVRSLVVMKRLAGAPKPWQAPECIAPADFEALLRALKVQEEVVRRHESELAALAGEWDDVLKEWHGQSVVAVKVARGRFLRTVQAPVWRGLKARGGGRARIATEGAAIEAAWESSDATWVPKPGLTFEVFQKLRTKAEALARAHALAANALAVERGILLAQADVLYDLCVQWYCVATTIFGADSPAGALIRTVPTNYDLKDAAVIETTDDTDVEKSSALTAALGPLEKPSEKVFAHPWFSTTEPELPPPIKADAAQAA